MEKSTNEEIRIGLVLYGGLSLAIYMNGVCNEFFRAVKGEGIYKLIKEIRECDIVIDIISGSSAGGINGIYLAYCLAHDLDFREVKNHLKDGGGALEFLNTFKRNKFKSLFDSSGSYEKMYLDSFKKLKDIKYEDINNKPSETKELDLFITGTNYYGDTDPNSKEGLNEESKNHGSLFLLKYRKYRKNLFYDMEICIEALARLARITSAFPGAFSPVTFPSINIDKIDKVLDNDKLNNNLRFWGDLKKNKYFFIDGGVVRNKPFSSTIKAIFKRNANKKIDRKLFLINPAPDKSINPNSTQDMIYPTFFNNIKNSILSISRYQSVKDDFDIVQERNLKVKNYFEIRDSLLKQFKEKRKLFDKYSLPEYYFNLRFEYFNNNIKILSNKIIIKPFLNKYDLYFRMRKVSFIIYIIYDTLYKDGFIIKKKSNEANLRESWTCLNKLLEIYEILINSMEKLNSPVGIDLGEFESCITQSFNIPKKYKDVKFKLKTLNSSSKINNLANNISLILNVDKTDKIEKVKAYYGLELIYKIDLLEKNIINSIKCKFIRLIFLDFEFFDKVLFPIQMTSEIMENDEIEIHRFSPKDANIGLSKFKKNYEKKICGDSVFHFGAFLKKSWRANDIMWGRIDGCCQIVEKFLDLDKVNKNKSDILKKNMMNKINENNIKDYFPNISNELSKSIINKQKYYEETNIPTDCEFEKFRNLLIEAEQIEIVMEEKKYIESALKKEKGNRALIKTLNGVNTENVKHEFQNHYNLGEENLKDVNLIQKICLIFQSAIVLTKVTLLDFRLKKLKNLLKSFFLLVLFSPVLMILFIYLLFMDLIKKLIKNLKKFYRMSSLSLN